MVVLIGLMGTGKTTVGRKLANFTGLKFVDSDEMIEARSGRKVREIFSELGESEFRRLEAVALGQACSDDVDIVLAVAGGAILSRENRELLKSSTKNIVWLDASTPTLVERTGAGQHRPLLADDPVGMLTKMRSDRESLYAEIATHKVVTESRDADQVVAEIVRLCEIGDIAKAAKK
ncbi:MAG: shikimate kinase [Actinobacteria bacterium]|nr:shikimate kinase [Actinomycetota bacterium]